MRNIIQDFMRRGLVPSSGNNLDVFGRNIIIGVVATLEAHITV
jgi:hypothetical protein